MRKFRAAPVAVVIHERKVIFQADARADRDDGSHQRRQTLNTSVLIGIVRNQKRAPVKKQAARQHAPPHHAHGIGAMSVLRPRPWAVSAPACSSCSRTRFTSAWCVDGIASESNSSTSSLQVS